MTVNVFSEEPRLIFRTRGYEVWARREPVEGTGETVYGVYTDRECEGYLGEVDTLAEARALGHDWVAEREAN